MFFAAQLPQDEPPCIAGKNLFAHSNAINVADSNTSHSTTYQDMWTRCTISIQNGVIEVLRCAQNVLQPCSAV
jgi:hypothetical protein